MGTVKINRTLVENVTFVRIEETGNVTLIDSTDSVKIINISGYDRYKVDGYVESEYVNVGNCMYFKGFILKANVGNCAYLSEKPEILRGTDTLGCRVSTFNRWRHRENRGINNYVDKKPQTRIIHLSGNFQRLELNSIANRYFHTSLCGKIRNLEVGNCLEFVGSCREMTVGNMAAVYQK